MNRIQDELTSERALKKFLRESDFTFLEKLSARISAALDEKRAEHIKQENQRRLREEKRNELLALIESEGFPAAELAGNSAAPSSAKGNRNTSMLSTACVKHGQAWGVYRSLFSKNWTPEKPSKAF